MVDLRGTKEVRQFLIQLGINKDHIFRIYNDKLVKGRRFKVVLAVYGDWVTGERALDSFLAKKIEDSLSELGMKDIYVSEEEIRFKNRSL